MEEDNSYVLDSSYLLAYLLPDVTAANIQKFFDRLKVEKIKLVSSKLLVFEVLNGLQTATRRKRISRKLAKELAKRFLLLPIEFIEVDPMKVLNLADKDKLTVYDATYLYLSKSEDLPLLTLDEKLKKA